MQTFLKTLSELLRKLWVVFFPPKIVEVEYIPPPPLKPIVENNQEKLIKIALDALDTEVTPKDHVPDEVACAEVVSTLIKKLFPDFPIIPSTINLFQKLKSDKRFKATLTTHIGCIVISPRSATQFGHTGIFITNERIASNDSKTGLFQGNYDWPKWIGEFIHRRGLRTILFEVL